MKFLDEAATEIDAPQVRSQEAEMHRFGGASLIAAGNSAAAERLLLGAPRVRSSGSCAPLLAAPGSGVTEASAPKLTICWRLSMTGSPKASIPLCSKTPRRCSTSSLDAVRSFPIKTVVRHPDRLTDPVRLAFRRSHALTASLGPSPPRATWGAEVVLGQIFACARASWCDPAGESPAR